MKITNYHDITFNWNNVTYRTYRKPKEKTNYINVTSDHLPSIIEETPQSIEKRLSTLSLSKKISRVGYLVWKMPKEQWI